MSLKDFKNDAVFMEKLKKYKKLNWLRVKQDAKLQLSEIPIVLFIMLTSIIQQMLAL